MKKFRSIEGLTAIFTHLRHQADYANIPHSDLPTINFTGTVKIHGTNAGLVIDSPDSVKATGQSKDKPLTILNDNAGFASFCYGLPTEVVQSIYQAFNPSGTGVLTVFGEWAGSGIQNGVGVSELTPHFIIFSACLDGKYIPVNKEFTLHEWRIYNIYELPTYSIDINFGNPGDIEQQLTDLTLAVEEACPWAAKFGVVGIGEGIVWFKTEDPLDSTFYFKVKGPLHSVRKNKNKKAVQIDVDKVNSVSECVDVILTENRMLQMVNDNHIEYVPINVGDFLKAVCQDCIKEEMEVIIKNGLIWKDVQGEICRRGKLWFLSHYKI